MIELGPEHEATLRAFEADFGEEPIPAYFVDRAWSHARKVEELAAWGRGERLQPGWDPCSTFFEVVHQEIVGVVNIRHSLSPALLRWGGHIGYAVRPSRRREGHGHRLLAGGLDFLRGLNVVRALLTCDPDNAPSRRIIEAGGGVLQDIHFHDGHQRLVCRYWIGL